MRGNELQRSFRFGCRRAGFPIPMRGNEDNGYLRWFEGKDVSDPHEG